ncbi:hypothetical protein [uncultured Helicobacter sp.]|uniref:hypothetical protein n=1 Tax=uncultured Helicobacter sp. TaxID=175537 RepID=UPI00261E0857|nr:hypothetical protein [uncultured Helicobacter sp.]
MRIFIVLVLFFGVFVFGSAGDNAPKENLSFLQEQKLESKNEFPFEMGQSPLAGISGFQYFGVILILLGLLAFLWVVKNRLNSPKIKARTSPLKFFDKDASVEEVQVQSVTTLSVQSKLIVFEAYNKRYLVILNSNETTLIDSYEIKNVFKDMLEQDNTNNAK